MRPLRLGPVLLALALCGCAAQQAYRQGTELVDAGRYEEGIEKLTTAANLDPSNHRYRADLVRARERAWERLIRAADEQRAAGKSAEARALYTRALAVNPADPQARAGLDAIDREGRHSLMLSQAQTTYKKGDLDGASERVRQILIENPSQRGALALQRQIEEQRVKEELATPVLRSRLTKPVNVQFRDATLRLVFDALSRSTAINFIFDREVKTDLKATIYAKDIPVEDAIDLILLPNQLEKKVLSENTVLIYPNTPNKQREYQDLVMKTFFLENANVKQIINMLRTMLKTKDLYIDEKLNLLVMRDTPDTVRLAERLIAAQDMAEPEVVLDVAVLEISRARLTELGIKYPTSATLTVIDPTAATPLTLQDLRNIGGRDGIAVSPTPSLTLNLRQVDADTNLLSNPRIRVKNRERARVLVGDRLPVISAVITPAATNPITTETVTYLDVGLKLEVEPEVRLDGTVMIKVNLEVSTAANQRTTQNGTTVYDIGTRTANTMMQLADGETQVLMGLIRDDDRVGANKVPGLGDIPILGRLFTNQLDDRQKTEIIMSITPRIMRNVRRADAQLAEFWSGTEAAYRTQPIALRSRPAKEGDAPTPSVTNLEPSGAAKSPGPAANAKVVPPAAPPAATAALAAPAVAAAAAPAMAFSWSGLNEARVGEPITLTLNAKSTEPVTSAALQISYDPLRLAVVEVTEGPLLAQGDARTVFNHKVDAARGRILVSVNRGGLEGAVGEGALLEVTFKPIAEAQSTPVQISVASPVGQGGRPIEATTGAKHDLSVAKGAP
jgi:general secretion pathway protein D